MENSCLLMIIKLNMTFTYTVNYLQYQSYCCDSELLKKAAQEISETKRDLLKEQEVFYFSDNRPFSLTKLRCKDYYNLFQEGKTTEPTAVKRWSSFFPYFATNWEQSVKSIYKSTKDNKLREFGYKIPHRVLVTNKEHKKFKIRNDDLCNQSGFTRTYIFTMSCKC